MRLSGIAGTGRKETLTGLNKSLLKMNRDKALLGRSALFRFVYIIIILEALVGGLPCLLFSSLLLGFESRAG